jgi:hypothetical protein
MSGIQDQVLEAIDAGCNSSAAIMEATSLEASQVYPAVSLLKGKGIIRKTDDGLVRVDGATPARVARVHEAVAGPAAAPQKPAKKRKQKRKANGSNGAASHPLPVPVIAKAAAPPVGFATFGEYVVLKMDDLRDLAELVARLDRWRPIAELVRG